MAKTGAERQAKYRATREDRQQKRLDVVISADSWHQLEALSKCRALSKGKALEKLIEEAAGIAGMDTMLSNRVPATLPAASPPLTYADLQQVKLQTGHYELIDKTTARAVGYASKTSDGRWTVAGKDDLTKKATGRTRVSAVKAWAKTARRPF